MKKFLLAALCAASLPALSAEVGVSVTISEPGVYGRIDIGRFPQPVLVVQQPVIYSRPVVVVQQPQPVYLWVPPGHRKEWGRYCGQYGACSVPVYFVQDQWYQSHVHAGPGRSGRGDDRDDHRDDHRGGPGNSQGKGNGNGNGQGKGKDH